MPMRKNLVIVAKFPIAHLGLRCGQSVLQFPRTGAASSIAPPDAAAVADAEDDEEMPGLEPVEDSERR